MLSLDLLVLNLPLLESSYSPLVLLHNLPELSYTILGPSCKIHRDVVELNIIEGPCTRKLS